ncbi:MAG: GNAT family N-acetyltransferase [Clostridiaceae bacterium]|nr:GNAT family N-acetyltransferase [Clostridiaceae bacterium]
MLIRELENEDIENIKKISYGYSSEKYYSLTKGILSYCLQEKSLCEKVQKSYSTHLYDETLESSKVFVIEEKNEIIGYIEMLYEESSRLLKIVNICIKEEYRHKNIARKLVKASKGYARFNKAKGIIVEVENYNFPAIRFFLKEDFKICGINELAFEDEIGILLGFEFSAI